MRFLQAENIPHSSRFSGLFEVPLHEFTLPLLRFLLVMNDSLKFIRISWFGILINLPRIFFFSRIAPQPVDKWPAWGQIFRWRMSLGCWTFTRPGLMKKERALPRMQDDGAVNSPTMFQLMFLSTLVHKSWDIVTNYTKRQYQKVLSTYFYYYHYSSINLPSAILDFYHALSISFSF